MRRRDRCSCDDERRWKRQPPGRGNTTGVTSRAKRHRNAHPRHGSATSMKSTACSTKKPFVRRPAAASIARILPARRHVHSVIAFRNGSASPPMVGFWKLRLCRDRPATCPKSAAAFVRRNGCVKVRASSTPAPMPVAIGAVEKFINEYAFTHGDVDAAVARTKRNEGGCGRQRPRRNGMRR